MSGAKVDWLTVTWRPSPDEHVASLVHQFLVSQLGAVRGVEVPGMFGYQKGVRFFVDLNGTQAHVARVDFGGNHHAGRARLDLSGSACALVRSWAGVQSWVATLFDYTLTRVDLAVDCLLGEFTVEDARDWYLLGEFNAGTSGRRPRHSLVGDWLDPHHGRTFEVGRRENGKMLRCYEKGRQKGDSASRWTRFEVELRNKDRVLPLDVLTDCDRYFVGAYACLRRLLDVAGSRIRTDQKEGEISLGRLLRYARMAYGQLVDVLRVQLDANDVMEFLSRPGVPRRLEKASLVGFQASAAPAEYLRECVS